MSTTLTRNSKLINRKFITYLIPSILMIFAMQFGSLVDGILIGNYLGPTALSASSLVMPILYIVQIHHDLLYTLYFDILGFLK